MILFLTELFKEPKMGNSFDCFAKAIANTRINTLSIVVLVFTALVGIACIPFILGTTKSTPEKVVPPQTIKSLVESAIRYHANRDRSQAFARALNFDCGYTNMEDCYKFILRVDNTPRLAAALTWAKSRGVIVWLSDKFSYGDNMIYVKSDAETVEIIDNIYGSPRS